MFVSSRRQTRLTALDLIAYLAAEDNPKQWLRMEETELQPMLDGTAGAGRLRSSRASVAFA